MTTQNERFELQKLVKEWDASGVIHLYKENQLTYRDHFGFSDRDNGIKTPKNPTVLLSTRAHFLQAIAIMQLVEKKKLSLDDTIDQFLPEYLPGKTITLRHLLLHESGIPDYFYGHIMLQKSRDKDHMELSEPSRYRLESQLFFAPISIHHVLDIINDQRLFQPGFKDHWSATNTLFIETIIERVTNSTITDYIENNVFQPLGIKTIQLGHYANTVSYLCMRDVNLLRTPFEGESTRVWTVDEEALSKIVQGLRQRQLLSEKSWEHALKPNKRGEALICHYRNGMEYYQSDVLGYEIGIYVDLAIEISFFHMSNEAPIFKLIDGNWMHFKAKTREYIEGLHTYPRSPYLDVYHERNAWDVMQLSIDPSQKEFVIDAKTSLCWAFSEPHEKQVRILMEGMRTIGLMQLAIDASKDIFAFDILIVDRRYQNRGYGKIMVEKGLELLKEAGAKKTDIVVNRFNYPAHRLYLSLGFKEIGVYESGLRLIKHL